MITLLWGGLFAVIIFTIMEGITPFVFWFMVILYTVVTINTSLENTATKILSDYKTMEDLFGDDADEINEKINEILDLYRGKHKDKDEDKKED